MRLKKKICGIMLSFVLVLGLMPGMSMIAQASTEETLLTTVTYTNGGSQTHSPEGVVTVTLNGVTFNDNTYGWLFFESGTVTVAPVDGVEITKVRFRQNGKNPVDDDLAPFTLTFNEGEGSVETSTGTVYAGSMDGVTSIEVYRSETIEEYTVTYKVVNGTWDGTSTADKTETVASGGKPASVPTGMQPLLIHLWLIHLQVEILLIAETVAHPTAVVLQVVVRIVVHHQVLLVAQIQAAIHQAAHQVVQTQAPVQAQPLLQQFHTKML